MVLVPAATTPHGRTSPLFNRLLYGHNTEPHPIFRDRPNANICEESARSTKVPHNMVGRTSFTRFHHSCALIMSTSIASHLFRAHNQVHTLGSSRTNTGADDTLFSRHIRQGHGKGTWHQMGLFKFCKFSF